MTDDPFDMGAGGNVSNNGSAADAEEGEGRGIPNLGLPMILVGVAGLLILTRARRQT